MPKTEKGEVTGGPEDDPIPKHGDPAPDDSPAKKTSEEDKTQEKPDPIYKSGDQEFHTKEELDAFIEGLKNAKSPPPHEDFSDLDRDSKDKTAKIIKNANQTSDADDDELGELLYKDPDKAIDKITERIEKKADARAARTDARNKFYGNFYDKNEDLQRHKAVVQFVEDRDFDELKKLSLKEAASELAKRARDFINDVRKSPGKEEELPSRGASTSTGASGTPSGSKGKPKSDAPTNFVDQVRKFQSRA